MPEKVVPKSSAMMSFSSDSIAFDPSKCNPSIRSTTSSPLPLLPPFLLDVDLVLPDIFAGFCTGRKRRVSEADLRLGRRQGAKWASVGSDCRRQPRPLGVAQINVRRLCRVPAANCVPDLDPRARTFSFSIRRLIIGPGREALVAKPWSDASAH